MFRKKILLRPHNFLAQQIIDAPIPAHSNFPLWYKKLPKFINSDSLIIKDNQSNATAKKCIPFMDSITAGYFLTVPADIQVRNDENGNKVLSWQSEDFSIVETHHPAQLDGYPLSSEYFPQPFKMLGFWGFQTPKKYSILVMHPLGRLDLPFFSMHAIVDSDLYYVPLNIPFFIKKDFEGIIKKGTPLVQIIPFKRNFWKTKIKNYKKFNPSIIVSKISLSAIGWYKENIWQKKEYK